eukprot:825138_1
MSPTESPTPSEPITIQFLLTVLADFAYAQESLNDANSNLDEWAYEVISNMISSSLSDVIITINNVDEGSNTIDYSLQSNSAQSLATAQATISSTSQVQAPGGAATIVSNTVVASPTNTPTRSPTASPTNSPTVSPTKSPTLSPTNTPTLSPTLSPTNTPTRSPTASPTNSPTVSPTKSPTLSPTNTPTLSPTLSPTNTPTVSPTKSPTLSPTNTPTISPTSEPITIQFLLTVLADFAYAQESLNDANSNLDEWAYEVISNMISSSLSDVIITINNVDEGSNTIDYSLQSNSAQSLATAQATISSTSQVQAPGGAATIVSNTVVA